MSQVDEYVKREVLELVKKGVYVTDSMVTKLRKDFINHRNNYNNKILACVDTQISKHRKIKTQVQENAGKVYIWHKDEAYYTEQEMIIGYVAPSYNQLSKEEKEIWKTK